VQSEEVIYLCSDIDHVLAFRAAIHTLFVALRLAAPDFALPGVDENFLLNLRRDYAGTAAFCQWFLPGTIVPIVKSMTAASRQLMRDYGKRGVAVVAIQGQRSQWR